MRVGDAFLIDAGACCKTLGSRLAIWRSFADMSQDKTTKALKKRERLKDALRDNLRRRKSQSRGRKQANEAEVPKNNHK